MSAVHRNGAPVLLPDPNGTPPPGVPKRLVWAAVDALAAELSARRAGRYLAWREAAVEARRAVEEALAFVPPELHREAQRDWTEWARAIVLRRRRGTR